MLNYNIKNKIPKFYPEDLEPSFHLHQALCSKHGGHTVKESPPIPFPLYKTTFKPPLSPSNFKSALLLLLLPSATLNFILSKSPSTMMPNFEIDAGEFFFKIAMFVLVQALVYFILSKSSNLFSKDEKLRSLSFKPARSVSIRRFLAALSDLPPGGELSPAARVPTPSSTRRDRSDDGARF